MLRADLADSLDRFLKGARRSRQPFGGIRLIMVGDLAQLPPVVTKEDGERFDGGEWDGPWFFQSPAIRSILDDNRLQGVELTRAHRQTDRAFLAALDDMRDGHPAPKRSPCSTGAPAPHGTRWTRPSSARATTPPTGSTG